MTTSIIVSKLDSGYSARAVGPHGERKCAIAGHSPDSIDATAAIAAHYIQDYGIRGQTGWTLMAPPEVMDSIPAGYRSDPISIFPGDQQ